VAVAKGGVGEFERNARLALGSVEARPVLEDRVDQLGADQPGQVVVHDRPLVVPGSPATGRLEDFTRRHAALALGNEESVVDADHRHVQLRDEQMDVVSRVADQSNALLISR
jgi:hypothetical protein